MTPDADAPDTLATDYDRSVWDVRVFDISADSAAAMALPERTLDLPKVAVVGLGYVGLPTALAFHEAGCQVLGIEARAARIDEIRARSVDLVPDDHVRLARALGSGRLLVGNDPASIAAADAVVVCVPTPVDEYLTPDLTPLRGACEMVVAHARAGQLILLTSTSYVGCTRDLVEEPLARRGLQAGTDINVSFSPERIDPGNTQHPQRTIPRVVGGVTEACSRRAAALVGRIAPVHVVASAETAEFTKLYENAFRAVNIAFANEMESASLSLGIAFDEVIAAAATKPFGFMKFHAGVGVGGHCIPCDPQYLLWQLRRDRMSAPLLQAAMNGIATRPTEIVQRAIRLLGDHGVPVRRSRVLVVGAAYKAGISDLRESPAVEIIDQLRRLDVDVQYTDALVRSLELHDGTTLASVADPAMLPTDLVIVHCLQPAADYRWLAGRLVLDPGGHLQRLDMRSTQQIRVVG